MSTTKYDLYYEQLNIAPGAEEDVIKKAYKKLALKFHPDKNKGDESATQKFLEIGTAYEKLMKMLRGEESGDEYEYEYDEKEAELDKLRRELARERKREQRRKEQDRWEEEFKMEQLKRKMQREREEREEEFRLKEEQLKRERLIREQSLRKRNDRLSFIHRSSTAAVPGNSTTFLSFSSYVTDTAPPSKSYSYSANLASKWGTPHDETEQDNGYGYEQDHRTEPIPESSSNSRYSRSYSSGFTDQDTQPSYLRRKYNSEATTPVKPDLLPEHLHEPLRNTFSRGSSTSSPFSPPPPEDPLFYRSTPHLQSSSRSSLDEEHIPYGRSASYNSSRKSSDHEESSSRPGPGTSSKPFEFSTFSNYLNATYNNPSRSTRGGSHGTSPTSTKRPSDFLSPSSYSSRSTGDLLSDDQEDEEFDENDSWFQSLPARSSKKKGSRLKEQLEWEAQFNKDRDRRKRTREEEEQREEERLKLEQKNEQVKRSQQTREKQRWESHFMTARPVVHDDFDASYRYYAHRGILKTDNGSSHLLSPRHGLSPTFNSTAT